MSSCRTGERERERNGEQTSERGDTHNQDATSGRAAREAEATRAAGTKAGTALVHTVGGASTKHAPAHLAHMMCASTDDYQHQYGWAPHICTPYGYVRQCGPRTSNTHLTSTGNNALLVNCNACSSETCTPWARYRTDMQVQVQVRRRHARLSVPPRTACVEIRAVHSLVNERLYSVLQNRASSLNKAVGLDSLRLASILNH